MGSGWEEADKKAATSGLAGKATWGLAAGRRGGEHILGTERERLREKEFRVCLLSRLDAL